MPLHARRSPRRLAPTVESLESRTVLSSLPSARAIVAAKAINLADGSGAGAILSAINGGPGNEFVTLIRRQVNINAALRQFVTGRKTEFDLKGVGIKAPHFAS